MLHNYRTQGKAWREHGITAQQVVDYNRSMADGSSALWEFAERFLADAVARGFIRSE